MPQIIYCRLLPSQGMALWRGKSSPHTLGRRWRWREQDAPWLSVDYDYCIYDPARDCRRCNHVAIRPDSPIHHGPDPFMSSWRLITPDE